MSEEYVVHDDIALFKKHFQSNQNINIYSLDAGHVFIQEHMRKNDDYYVDVESLLFRDNTDKPLHRFVSDNYKTILTRKQVEYLDKSDEELAQASKQLRYSYRRNMSKRIMLNLLGMNVPYYHRLNGDLLILATARKLIRSALEDSMIEFVTLLKSECKYRHVERLVYDRLSPEANRAVVYALRTLEPIPAVHVYELINILYHDIETVGKTIRDKSID